MTAIAEITRNMITFFNGNLHDISHFMKVWGYAKTIGELERLDENTQYILEVAAIIHDIACPLCRTKYGNAGGKLQEIEGPELVRDFLKESELTSEEIERVAYLVGHHHTYSGVNGADYQILLEADYLVNAEENHYSLETIEKFGQTVFRTKAGIELLKSMFSR